MKRWQLIPLLILAQILAAQGTSDLFDKAPPYIDDALRARINLFYQSHVDGKFRQADTVVAEDSKDAFFAAPKEQYKGFKIIRINYSNDFTEANVVVAVDTDFVMLGFGRREVSIPLPSLWKYEDGEWWWHVQPPDEGVETPFGVMKPVESSGRDEVMNRISNIDAATQQILSLVTLDKPEATLSSHEHSTDEIIITNGMPGPISLRFHSKDLPGYDATLDRDSLGAGEQAKITFTMDPINVVQKPDLTAELTVLPANYVIPIKIHFLAPPEGLIDLNAQ